MKLRIKGLKLNIPTNELNRENFWNPIGMFYNIPLVEREGTWYNCWLTFTEREGKHYMQINSLSLQNERHVILHMEEEGVYKELPISKFQRSFIEFLLNTHSLNHLWFGFRRRVYNRRNTILVFSASITLALTYYFGNEYYNGAWQTYIANNSILQALFILLNIFTFGSVFFPFTIQKQLNEKDIRAICQEEAEKFDKEKEQLAKIRQRASF